jgi:hypothetical protein
MLCITIQIFSYHFWIAMMRRIGNGPLGRLLRLDVS